MPEQFYALRVFSFLVDRLILPLNHVLYRLKLAFSFFRFVLRFTPKLAFLASATVVGKAEEVKSILFSFTVFPAVLVSVASKPYYAGLLFRHLKVEFGKPLFKRRHKCFRILFVLKADHEASSPGEFHHQALSELGVNLSAHQAPIIQPQILPPFASAQKALVHAWQFHLTSV